VKSQVQLDTEDVKGSGVSASIRFGLMDFARGGSDAWRTGATAEQLGFDMLATGDHLFHFARPEASFLDG
jgi:hypothetical protein